VIIIFYWGGEIIAAKLTITACTTPYLLRDINMRLVQKSMKFLSIIVICLTMTMQVVAETNDRIAATFLPAERPLWQEKSFKGHTDYAFISKGDSVILKAHCDKGASALYRHMKVNLTKTPILHWAWKIDKTHDGLDDVSRDGDDYAARIYVVYKGRMPWDVIAINYVWANKQQQGKSWLNAFSDRAIMVAQKSGRPNNIDIWLNEQRNVRQDFKRYFGRDVSHISGIAVMTDCDNGGGKTRGYYRDIWFTSNE